MLTLFLLTLILLPYLLYTLAAKYLNWQDRRQKSAVRHTNEIVSALLLGTSIYFLGGYAESFHWIIPLVAAFTVLVYGQSSEFKALQTSLLHVRSWTWQMWVVTCAAAALTVGFVGLHVNYAIARWGFKVASGGYLGSFILLPLFSGTLIYGIVQAERSKGAIDDFEMAVGESAAILHEVDAPEHELGSDIGDDEGDVSNDDVDSLRNLPPQPIRTAGPTAIDIQRKLKVHLHHYQIFAFLALFTRFPTLCSRIAAGLALGSMTHGIAAYGMDSIFEYEEVKG